jgi:hypothetical protein
MRYAGETDREYERRHRNMTVTSPAVTELPRPLEPVSRDTFLDDLAIEEETRRPRDEDVCSAPNRR